MAQYTEKNRTVYPFSKKGVDADHGKVKYTVVKLGNEMALGPKNPRLYDPGYLAFLRGKPCCICGKVGETEAAHIRIGLFAKSMKPHDKHATPLCRDHHRHQHTMNELLFWGHHHINPFEIAEQLYTEYGGTGGKPRAPRKIKPRKPPHLRQKIQSRGSR